jgi:glycerol-3-phosphate acyltransferase PlsX
MRIVLDAMGSDNRPIPDLDGAVLASQDFPEDTIVLTGDEAVLHRELANRHPKFKHMEIVHASETISMSDKPGTVIKERPDSSIHVGLELVKAGKADAFVTAGNTGATLAIATLASLGRITGIKRPALGSILKVPNTDNRRIILLDIGATVDAKPEWMVQFAMMGAIYARQVLKLDNPRIGLLSNGEEDSKGNQAILDTHALLRALPGLNFAGNVEPGDALKGEVDVVVSDGFIGNIAIKSLEAMGSTIGRLIRSEAKKDPISMIGGLLMRSAFKRVYKQIDPTEIGGAPLLGVKGVVIIGHGRSNALAIRNAIAQARLAVESNIVQAIQSETSRL